MRSLRLGVVGLGHLGQHHARLLSRMVGVDLVAVVDVNYDRAVEVAKRTGATPYQDYHEILGKVDATTVVVPTSHHYEVAKSFLLQGKDVLVEKPITDSVQDALELIQIAHDKDLIVQVGHLEQFNGAVTKLHEIVTRPCYIESQRLAPFVPRSTDIDVVLDLMIHDLDVILSIVCSPVRSIRAIGHPVLTPCVDIASAWIEFESGCVANVTASRVSKDKIRKIRIFQPESYISLDYSQQQISVLNRIFPNNGNGNPKLVEEIHEIERDEPLKVELASFVHSITTREPPRVSGEAGLEALRLALEVTKEIAPKVKAFNLPVPGSNGRPIVNL